MITKEQAKAPYYALMHYICTHDYIESDILNYWGITDEIVHRLMRCKIRIARFVSRYNVMPISLGGDCMPRYILTKWGLLPTNYHKPKDRKGSLPFDLGIINFKSLIKVLSNNFDGYEADSICINSFNGEHYFSNSVLGIKFVNDIAHDMHNSRSSIDKFNTDKLLTRIERFRNYSSRFPVLYLCNILDKPERGELDKLKELLNVNSRSSGKRCHSIYIISPYDLNTDLPYLKYSLPDSYSFWQAEHYLTPVGFKFEYDLIKNILKHLALYHSRLPSSEVLPHISIFKSSISPELFTYIACFYYHAGDISKTRLWLQRGFDASSGKISNLWMSIAKHVYGKKDSLQ